MEAELHAVRASQNHRRFSGKHPKGRRNHSLCRDGCTTDLYTSTKTGAIVGFEPDIIHVVSTELGIKTVKYVNIPFVSYIPALQAHKCDIVMGGIAITTQRAKAPGIEYTFPYFRYTDVVIVKATSPYHAVSQLRDKKIAAVTSSVEAIEAQDLATKLGDGTSTQLYSSVAAPYLAVLNGTDAALIDLLATYRLHPSGNQFRALPGLVVAPVDKGDPYYPSSGAIITTTGEGSLNSAISVALGGMIQSGSLAAILKKWNIYQPGVTSFIRPA